MNTKSAKSAITDIAVVALFSYQNRVIYCDFDRSGDDRIVVNEVMVYLCGLKSLEMGRF